MSETKDITVGLTVRLKPVDYPNLPRVDVVAGLHQQIQEVLADRPEARQPKPMG